MHVIYLIESLIAPRPVYRIPHDRDKGPYRSEGVKLKGTLPRKSMWALTVKFSEKTTMVPFIWV